MKVVTVVGARPNFVKLPSLVKELKKRSSITSTLIHTGQHYDGFMSDVFFSDLDIEKPDIFFGVKQGSQVSQIANIMLKAEESLVDLKPDLIIVLGDVNSTLALALTGNKMGIPIAHVEAGLRSGNWNMPEESNRVITDRLSELLFTPTHLDSQTLLDEGIESSKIFMVGNIMIDSLLKNLDKASDRESILKKLNLEDTNFALLTLHRPECVDNKEKLSNVIFSISEIQEKINVIWPLHPRTRKNLEDFELFIKIEKMKNLKLIKPLGYLDFLSLMKNASFVLTDSGGIQEETTVLGIPCLTIREETERPITVSLGTNNVVGLEKDNIIKAANELLNGKKINGEIPEYWDGNSSVRIVNKILEWHAK